jgi:branched-subunit amino acid aminotransferase/4-amino-4-deoxychorismate lyase
MPQSEPLLLAHGVGVFTSFRWPMPPAVQEQHWQRLNAHAQALGLVFTDGWPTGMPNSPCRVRLTIAPVSTDFSALRQAEIPARLVVSVTALTPAPTALRLVTVPFEKPYPTLKHCSLLPAVMTLRQHPQADEVLWVNPHGQVTEATNANFWAQVADGHWVTAHPERDGCLAGIARHHVLGLLPCQERALTEEELPGVQAAFVSNAVWGLVPVTELNGRVLPWPNRVGFEQLQGQLSARLWAT